jgi:hypothetical protein
MNNKKELHLGRLRESLQDITSFRDNRVTAFDPNFKTWKDRTKQSLDELFGSEHNYTRRFSSLVFQEICLRVNFTGRGSGSGWSSRDQETFDNDLDSAHAILKDALEEFPILAKQVPPTTAETPSPRHHIVVNVTNVLSQTTHVELSQILSTLDSLGLSHDELPQAKTYAQELAAEAQGQQRWPILAKSLEVLKSMGKSVYENVALPLLLEMLKKQTGLNR